MNKTVTTDTQTKARLSIGRGQENDIVLDFPHISYEHAWLIQGQGEWLIEDRNSTNHTYVNDRSQPVSRKRIDDNDTIFFGSYKISVTRLLKMKKDSVLGCTDNHAISIAGAETIFGRDPASTIHLDFPQISWHHARLVYKDNEYILKDLGSTNGTFVNGSKISSCKITPSDDISFGSFSFRLTEDYKIVKRDYRDDIRLDAENISIVVKDHKTGGNKTLLDNVSLSIYPSEFIGLMGPSGAGKTTLLLALNGYLPPNTGSSKINGRSLYNNYDAYRGSIGYVPQDDVLHPELTVYEALYYTAKLRLPSDTRDKEIELIINRILSQLGLLDPEDKNKDVRNVIIGSPEKKGISGGQRKRVNLAMELLTGPSLLFLDEPTSGLSSEDTLVVMDVLRKLANEGKTIILTIHQPSLEAYRKMDNVIILSSGKLMYYGPAYPDSITFFNPEDQPGEVRGEEINMPDANCKCPECGHNWYDVTNNADNVLRGLSGRSDEEWVREYNKSEYYQTYIRDRKDSDASEINAEEKAQKASYPFNLRQWWSLTKRYFIVKKKDWVNTAILLTQAPIIAVIISIVFSRNSNHTIPLFLLVLSSVWFGASNSAREIVAENAIYRRERMVKLKIPSYFFSKYAVLSLLCFIQCVIMVGIIYPALGLKGNLFQMIAVTFLSSLAGLSIGLFISSIMKTQQAAIAIVPIVLLPMVILSGGIISVKQMNKPTLAMSYAMPTRWAFEKIIHVEDDGNAEYNNNQHAPNSGANRGANPASYTNQLYGDNWKKDETIIFIMVGFILSFIGLTMGVLKKKDIV